MLRRAFAFFLLLTLAAAAPARADEPFRIGVLNDQSGPYADLSGPGGAESARMAVEDFGGSVLGKPIELLVADHQNKVDVGLAVARQWYDARGVRAIFDITNSGVGLAVQDHRMDCARDHSHRLADRRVSRLDCRHGHAFPLRGGCSNMAHDALR